jgi:CDP-diacylglycerol--glycerol-3-phosphate 3-phosphatidyltransferase
MNSLANVLKWPGLPNCLTLSRLTAVPVVILCLALGDGGPFISGLAAVVYLTAALSDLLDGHLARKYHNESNLGRFLDPMADKLLVASAMIMLVPLGRTPAWVAFLIVARELMVTSLRAVAAEKGLVIAASAQGKRKTLAQNIAMFCLLWRYDLLWANTDRVGSVILYVALAATYWSGALYFRDFLRADRQAAEHLKPTQAAARAELEKLEKPEAPEKSDRTPA